MDRHCILIETACPSRSRTSAFLGEKLSANLCHYLHHRCVAIRDFGDQSKFSKCMKDVSLRVCMDVISPFFGIHHALPCTVPSSHADLAQLFLLSNVAQQAVALLVRQGHRRLGAVSLPKKLAMKDDLIVLLKNTKNDLVLL